MTPYQFGYKLAADTAAPSTPFGKPAPGRNPAGYDIKTDEQARMWRDHGTWAGANKFTRAPRPHVPPRPSPAPNPEHQQTLNNFRKLYPQFSDGAHRDMLQLSVQNDGAGLAKFIRNTQRQATSTPPK